MKKKKLFVALAALIAVADASALTRTTDGTGEAVLLPYFHAAGGESTLFAVTNHSDEAKAVRVVIVEGRNGRPALTFNVYLSARDSWNAAIVPGADGAPPRLMSNEESCTAPSIAAAGVPLRNVAFTGSRNDGLGNDAARLQQGSIELIEMGVPMGEVEQLIEARDCEALIARFVEGVWEDSPNDGVGAPAGGLAGEAQIIDIPAGVAFGSEPVVLDDFSFAPRHGPASADFDAVRFFKPTVSWTTGEFVVDGGARIAMDRPADAVSLTLMSAAFEAGFMLGDALDASTRFVLTLPTRAAYVDNLPGGERPAGSAPAAPFDTISTATAPHCIDTEWQAIDGSGDIGAPQVLPMCEQVNVIELAQSPIDGGDFVTGSDGGRVRIGLLPGRHALQYGLFDGTDVRTHEAHGLPAVVQSLTEVRNANAQPGVLASYAISHRVMRVRDFDIEF